jgi:hypothetical protein
MLAPGTLVKTNAVCTLWNSLDVNHDDGSEILEKEMIGLVICSDIDKIGWTFAFVVINDGFGWIDYVNIEETHELSHNHSR